MRKLTINYFERSKIDQALQEGKIVYFALYNTIDGIEIQRDSEKTYRLSHQSGSYERIINSSISEEIIADTFIDCVLSMYNDTELSKGYIEIK